MSSKDKERKKKAREKRVAQKKLAQTQKRHSEQPAGQESNVQETSKLATMAPIPKVDSVAGQSNQRSAARRRASY